VNHSQNVQGLALNRVSAAVGRDTSGIADLVFMQPLQAKRDE
jgi:hypothetical protein